MEKQKKVQVGDRNYYINSEKLLDIEKLSSCSSDSERKYSEFERYLIQEGIKEILFCKGSDEVADGLLINRMVSPEMIQFLKDHDLLREM